VAVCVLTGSGAAGVAIRKHATQQERHVVRLEARAGRASAKYEGARAPLDARIPLVRDQEKELIEGDRTELRQPFPHFPKLDLGVEARRGSPGDERPMLA
jgi:hypothetical protein